MRIMMLFLGMEASLDRNFANIDRRT